MVNLPIAHFASVNGPLWNKTTGGRSRPEEVKFYSQGRTQDIFLWTQDRRNGILIFSEK